MKKILLFILVIASIGLASFTIKKSERATMVFVYGLVINYGCDDQPETTVDYKYSIVEESKYKKETEVIRNNLLEQYPKSKRVETGSSFYQYGAEAAAVVIMKQSVQYPNRCQYFNYIFGWGKSAEEALNKAQRDCITSNNNITCEVLFKKTW